MDLLTCPEWLYCRLFSGRQLLHSIFDQFQKVLSPFVTKTGENGSRLKSYPFVSHLEGHHLKILFALVEDRICCFGSGAEMEITLERFALNYDFFF